MHLNCSMKCLNENVGLQRVGVVSFSYLDLVNARRVLIEGFQKSPGFFSIMTFETPANSCD